MANTTFNGAVRSENGFKVISKNSSTGAVTEVVDIASTGIVTDKYIKHVGFATGVTVNSTAGDSPAIGEFTQPANTIITDIKIFCDVSSTGTGNDLGFEVGTSSSGAQIVAQQTDQIIDAGADGTDLAPGAFVVTTLVVPTEDGTTLAANPAYSAAARTVYLNTTCTNAAAVVTPGTARWIIEYVQVA